MEGFKIEQLWMGMDKLLIESGYVFSVATSIYSQNNLECHGKAQRNLSDLDDIRKMTAEKPRNNSAEWTNFVLFHVSLHTQIYTA